MNIAEDIADSIVRRNARIQRLESDLVDSRRIITQQAETLEAQARELAELKSK